MNKKELRRLNEEAMLHVLENNKGTVVEIILRLAWNMGLSREEMCRLKWDEVSFIEGRINLPDRSVPLDEDAQRCLEARKAIYEESSDFIVISDRRRDPMRPESVSRIARTALDAGGLPKVSLIDLRHDFVFCQLEQHDWSYVARISGMTISTLYKRFSKLKPLCTEETFEQVPEPLIDEFKLWKILQSEGASPAGLAIWMSWKLGMQAQEIISLTWTQVDLDAGTICLTDRQISIGTTLERLLRQVHTDKNQGTDPHVLLTPRSKQPYDLPHLSRLVRTVLIRGDMEELTLRDLTLNGKWEENDTLILHHAQMNGSITRSGVMELLQMTRHSAYYQLRRLTEKGKLVKVGVKYYPADAVVPPKDHYKVIRAYLENVGSAYRQEIANLLHVDLRPCHTILKRMVDDGRLLRSGQRYYLPDGQK